MQFSPTMRWAVCASRCFLCVWNLGGYQIKKRGWEYLIFYHLRSRVLIIHCHGCKAGSVSCFWTFWHSGNKFNSLSKTPCFLNKFHFKLFAPLPSVLCQMFEFVSVSAKSCSCKVIVLFCKLCHRAPAFGTLQGDIPIVDSFVLSQEKSQVLCRQISCGRWDTQVRVSC